MNNWDIVVAAWLTGTELRLVPARAQGLGAKEAADMRGITRSTCYEGRVSEALALYESIFDLGPVASLRRQRP